MQARVLGTVGAVAWAGIPFGGLVAGGAVNAVGLSAALAAAAVLYVLASLPPFVFRSWRGMERRAEPSPEQQLTGP